MKPVKVLSSFTLMFYCTFRETEHQAKTANPRNNRERQTVSCILATLKNFDVFLTTLGTQRSYIFTAHGPVRGLVLSRYGCVSMDVVCVCHTLGS